MGKLWIFFRADLPERKKRFPSWAGAEKLAVDLNFGEKNGILVATGPGPRQIEVTSPQADHPLLVGAVVD